MRSFLVLAFTFLCCASSSVLAAKTRHFKWAVEYMYHSPDCLEGVVIGINGQFPGPTIRARAGDTLHIELTNKLHTEGVVIHWHGIRQNKEALRFHYAGDSLHYVGGEVDCFQDL